MPLLVALVVKEFQVWLRGRFAFLAFALVVLMSSLLVFFLGLLILAPDANAVPALFSTSATTSINLLAANRALFLYGAVALCTLLAAGAVAPAVAASAFAFERERRTMDLLLLQGPGPMRIVAGKVLAALLFSLLTLLVGAPLFAVAWLFGGVQSSHIMATLGVTLSATFLFCALGVFAGAIIRSALTAALFAQGAALFLLFGTFILYAAFAVLGGNESLKLLLWFDPFLALISAGGVVTEQFARQVPVVWRGALLLSAPPMIALPIWGVASLLWTAMGILLMGGAAMAIDPCHPLKVRRLS
jgi:ABC-type transport system involved in multi-copper enzyme maturation permease subunit